MNAKLLLFLAMFAFLANSTLAHKRYYGGGEVCPPCNCQYNQGGHHHQVPHHLPPGDGYYGANTGYGASAGASAVAVAGSYGGSNGHVSGGY